MATKQVSVRLAAVGGAQVKAELVEIGTAGERSFNQLDRSSRLGGGGLQNLGFQVQDFAVQVGAGTSATQALSQQLPQLLSGFGLLGVALGTASAVAIPLLAMAFGDLREEILSTDAAVQGLQASTDALRKATEVFSAEGLAGLAERYGEVSAAVLLLSQRQANLAAEQAKESARAAAVSFSAEFSAVLGTRRGAIADFLGLELGFVNTREQVEQVLPRIAEFEQILVDIETADSFGKQAEAIARMLSILDDTTAKGGAFYQQLLQAEAATRAAAAAGGGVTSWLDAAITGAQDLASGLWDAAGAALSVGQNQEAARAAAIARYDASGERTGLSGPDGVRSEMMGGGRFTPRVTGAGLPAVAMPARRGGGASGGGGQSDDMREAARIFDETRTAAERYADELARLNELKAGGYLADDTYARAMENLRDKTGQAADAMKGLGADAKSAFVSIITDFGNAEAAAARFFSSIAENLAGQAFDGIFGGKAIGGVLSGLFGGGRAGGGPVLAGRSYMVGESGPELVTMGGNGTVTPNAALRSAVNSGGGGMVVNIDASGAVEGVAAQIEQAIARALPGAVRASVAGVRAASARGY